MLLKKWFSFALPYHSLNISSGETLTDGHSILSAAISLRQSKGSHYLNFWTGGAAIVIIGAGLRFWNLGKANLWTDETLTAFRASAPFRQSLDSLLNSANQTPLYYWLSRVLPYYDEFWLRLPSAMMGVAGIVLFMFVVLRFYDDWGRAFWGGALLATNPYHILLSRTARSYTLVFLLSLLVLYTFVLLLRGRQSRPVWVVFIASSSAAYHG